MSGELKPKRAYRKTSETQKIIFDKALSIMSEHGFQGTTVREICAQANIPIGTFYNCYKSKVDILKSIYEDGDKYILDAMSSHPQPESCIERLKLFAHHYAKLNEATGIDSMRVLFYPSNEWFSEDRPMQVLVSDIVREGQAKGEIRNDLEPGLIVDYFFDIYRGICYNWCIYNGSFDLTERMESHAKLFCEVLKPSK